jgi:hypothetical protein
MGLIRVDGQPSAHKELMDVGCGGVLALVGLICSICGFRSWCGDPIRFWFDRWCGDHPLKDVFPDLFACASNLDATIDSLLIQSVSGSRSEWNVTFVRYFNDWEVEGVVSFEFLHYHASFKEGGDGLRLRLKGNGVFDIRSFYSVLRGSQTSEFPL